ncbi:MAG: transglycosylase domain-containing protein [Akkermansiaceae bacterium]|jgi:penicillin-binding protein 1A|nr:transglycosylase domain-containing protein [Akkermansiaceae bacterium]
MAKRKSNDDPQPPANRRRKPAPKPHGLGTILLFWPFLLLQRISSGFGTPARLAVRTIGHPIILGLYFFLPFSLFYYARARGFDMAKVAEMPERSVVLDRHGEEIGRIHGEKRDIISYSDISLDFIYAIVAREDERFFTHHGVDWIGFGRAFLRNIKERKMKEGASTLTMQLARNSYSLNAPWLSFSDGLQELDRKFLEMAVTFRIESHYTKEEILEHYVNRIFWGHTIRGIEEASRTYFEKSAKDLTLSEAALLAGIVRGPNAFSPFRDIEDSLRERDTTLDRMVTAGFISAEEAAAAKAIEIKIRPEWRRVFHDSWAMDAVRRELERILEDEDIEFGGLQITTTIDLPLQTKAEEALNQHLRSIERGGGYAHQTRAAWQDLPEPRPNPQYVQGALVVVENLTGSIVATVGGRDADESKFNRANQARRQLGSTFKPFVYAAAFMEGLRPDATISDDPLSPGEVKGAGRWSPQNSDGKFNGYQSVEYGLIRSRNTMAVRIGNFAGIENVAELARQVGFIQKMRLDPTAYLGTLEASPEELASAFTVFPNGGTRIPPRIIAEIRDRNGNLEYQNPRMPYTAVADENAALTTATMLGAVVDRGTAARLRSLGFSAPAGGKTGTTNDYKDAWFVGFTSSLSCAVWVGFDQPKTIIDRGFGSTLSLPIWAEVMKSATRLGYRADGLRSNLSFTERRVCKTTGKLAHEGCEHARTAYTLTMKENDAPQDYCATHVPENLDDSGAGRPPKATAIDPSAVEVTTTTENAPRARPVEETPAPQPAPQPAPEPEPAPADPEPAPRALPVQEEEVPRALPVEEEPVPRAIPVE